MNNEIFEDALKPIVDVPRYTIGKLCLVNPEELNQSINFFTTSGFRNSTEFERNIAMIDSMAELNGEMVLGGGWHLGSWYGRSSTKSAIINKKKTMSPIAFARNYESRWVGASDNALVNINKLMNLRTIAEPEFTSNGKYEYVLGVDVARSENTSNNQSSVAILKLHRNANQKITMIGLVNLVNISNALTFTAQAIKVKQLKRDYRAKIVVVDSNGLGKGLLDELMKENIDPQTGESLPCLDSINNADLTPEIEGAEKVIYDLKPQSAQNEVIISFMDMVESSKLQLLEKKVNSDYDVDDAEYKKKLLPFLNTDFLIEEIANLKTKQLASGKYTVEKVIRKIDKDRFSALAYGLWYVKMFEDNTYQESTVDPLKFLFIN